MSAMQRWFSRLMWASLIPASVAAAQNGRLDVQPVQVQRGIDGLPGVAPLFEAPAPVWPPPSDANGSGEALDPLRARNLRLLQQRAAVCTVKAERAGPVAAESAWVLGLLLLHGRVGSVDTAAAAARFEDAWRCGHRIASAGLAWCAMVACAGPASVESARRWIETLLRVQTGRALFLQWTLESRLAPVAESGRVSPENDGMPGAEALTTVPELLANAAGLGDAQARNELGIRAFMADRLDDSIRYFRAAAETSDAARFNLSVALARRTWLALQTPGASGRAGEGRSAGELYELARRYHRGEGVPADYPEAIRLYRQAQLTGSVKARRMLELIYSRPNPAGGIDPEWMSQLARVDPVAATPSPDGQSVDSVSVRRFLRRDPTPVYDLVPALWRR